MEARETEKERMIHFSVFFFCLCGSNSFEIPLVGVLFFLPSACRSPETLVASRRQDLFFSMENYIL